MTIMIKTGYLPDKFLSNLNLITVALESYSNTGSDPKYLRFMRNIMGKSTNAIIALESRRLYARAVASRSRL